MLHDSFLTSDILEPVLSFVQKIAGFFFYALGSGFFLAYVLLKNEIGGVYPALFLQVFDLPLLASAMLYGGISFYRSLVQPGTQSKALAVLIGVPLLVLFLLMAGLNYLPVLRG